MILSTEKALVLRSIMSPFAQRSDLEDATSYTLAIMLSQLKASLAIYDEEIAKYQGELNAETSALTSMGEELDKERKQLEVAFNAKYKDKITEMLKIELEVAITPTEKKNLVLSGISPMGWMEMDVLIKK